MEEKMHKEKLPQEGTALPKGGQSLTDTSVCPSYSGGGTLCVKSGASLDLSGLTKALQHDDTAEEAKNTTPAPTTWTVVAHERKTKQKGGKRGHPERRRPDGRARREATQPDLNPTKVEATAAAETQREPPPLTYDTSKPRRKRGSRRRRPAAAAPTAPEKEQRGGGAGPAERVSSKRARLDETQSPRGEAKRAKTDTRPGRATSYADATQSHLRVAIITVPPRDLSQAQAEQLREAIDDGILQAVLSPPAQGAQAPSFRGRPFLLDGALAMWCEDANALSWLEAAVPGMTSPIADTTLTVIRQSEMKKKLKAGLLLHTKITNPTTLHTVLRVQNPWYKVDSWQCYDMTVDDKPDDRDSKEKKVHLILGIPEDQKQVIINRDRRVAHMSGSGYIRFFAPEETEAAAQLPTATSDAGKETSSPMPSTSAPQSGLSDVDLSSPRMDEGSASEDDDVLSP